MNRRIAIIAALVVAGLFVIAGTAFGIDRGINGGEILGRVSVLDVDLGGLGRDDARAALEDLEAELADAPIEVTAAGETFTLIPSDVGFGIDVDALLDEAFSHGRSGNWFGQVGWWFGKWGSDGIDLDLPASFDAAALEPIIEAWELEGIDAPPSPGDVAIVDTEVVPEYPRTGTGIDREAAAAILADAILDPTRPAVELPTRVLEPALTDEDIDAVAAEAERLLDGSVRLINQDLGSEIEIPRHVLAEALVITRDDSGDVPTFDFAWDDGPLRDFVEPRRRAYQTEATDAELQIGEDDVVRIVPSIPSQAPSLDVLAEQVAEAVASVTRTGPLAYDVGFDAEVTTADIEALGIKEKLAEFTTYHNCCENRVINIQTIADATDGALIAPGETFSLNDHVGQRTTEKGYVAAGAIISGYVQCCDSPINIGGGTSQFSTTLYNAVFYAGLEDVYHMPHTIYFSRYPEGIEATMGYPAPDLVFRNNTESYVLIKTEYTGTSITAKIFGDNGGIEVEAERSGRFNYTGPITRYEEVDEWPDVCGGKNGTTRVKEPGGGGWSIKVYRHITYPEGHYAKPEGGTSTEEWVWHYDGPFKVVEYNKKDCPDPPPPDPDP